MVNPILEKKKTNIDDHDVNEFILKKGVQWKWFDLLIMPRK